MNHSTINNQFIFNLPVGFVPASIEAKRQGLFKKNHILYDSVLDFLNSCIKEINFPDVTFEQTEQTLMRGKKRQYKSAKNVYDSFSRDIRITFRNVNSNLSYLLMLECILYHYNDVINTFMEQIMIQIIDEYRDEIYRIVFKEVIIKNMSEFVMQYNNQLNEDNTFTITFTYNFMDIEYVIDNSDIIKDEKSFIIL
jgi:hypothetical protein